VQFDGRYFLDLKYQNESRPLKSPTAICDFLAEHNSSHFERKFIAFWMDLNGFFFALPFYHSALPYQAGLADDFSVSKSR
jgi:hypothetical protein